MVKISTIIAAISLSSLSAQAQEMTPEVELVFKDNCTECHSPNSRDEKARKDIPDILDVRALIERGKLVPGNPDASEIWKQVKTDQMPDGVIILDGDSLGNPPVPEDQKDILYKWIASLDPGVELADRKFVSDAQVLRFIFEDLSRFAQKRAKEHRYFTLTNLYNDARIKDEELELARIGLSKMINSLSWKHKIVVPQPVDPDRTVFRVNIRRLGWSDELWDSLAKKSPYKKQFSNIFYKSISNYVGTNLYVLRADWFVSKVSKPPFYHLFAQIPKNVEELERRLLYNGRTADENLNANPGEVVRAGFNHGNSGVSLQNRLIERHSTKHNGAYWRSFDFEKVDPSNPSTATRDFFKFPMGPGGTQGFTPDGGEIIFNLPNGLQAYMLIEANGERIDTGPTKIVFDRNAAASGRDLVITNGISCISCHSSGMIIKEDELLGYVEKAIIPPDIREYVEELHRPEDLASAFEEDRVRFIEAFRKAIDVTDQNASLPVSRADEPVSKMVYRFDEENVDLIKAAAELGIPADQLEKNIERILAVRELTDTYNQLKNDGVSRTEFITVFGQLANALGIKVISVDEINKTDVENGVNSDLVDKLQKAERSNIRDNKSPGRSVDSGTNLKHQTATAPAMSDGEADDNAHRKSQRLMIVPSQNDLTSLMPDVERGTTQDTSNDNCHDCLQLNEAGSDLPITENMTRENWIEVQKILSAGGYYKGAIDGIAGLQTMAAVKEYNKDYVPKTLDDVYREHAEKYNRDWQTEEDESAF